MIKRFFKLIFATLILIVAILGFLLPILPGIPFLFAAILIFRPKDGKKIVQFLKDKISKLKEKARR